MDTCVENTPWGRHKPGRGSEALRPSWRTATSGRCVPRGDAAALRQDAGLPQADRAVVGPSGLAMPGGRVGRPPASRTGQGRPRGGREVGAAAAGAGRRLGDLPGAAGPAGQLLAIPPEMPTPAVAPPETARSMPEAVPEAATPPAAAEATAGRGSTRWNYLTVARLSKLIVEQEWALLNEALPPPGEFDPRTATDDQIKAYLVLHPEFCQRPPRRTAHVHPPDLFPGLRIRS